MTRTDDPAQWDDWAFAPGPQPARPTRAPARQRTRRTPEAKVTAAVDKYLEKLTPRPIVTRANAGHWEGEGGHVIMGAKAGTSDKLCLFEGGIYVALELKAAGRQTPAQAAFQQRVEALGGLYILARSVDDVRRALAERFGAETVKRWEGK